MEFEFAEELSAENYQSAPEEFRPFYKQDGETFKLDKSDPRVANSVRAIVGLNTALKASRLETKEAKKGRVDLSKLSAFGEDVDTIAEKVQAKISELTEQVEKGGKINIEKIRAEIQEAANKELGKATERNKTLEGQIYKLLVSNEATQAIAAEKGVKSAPELLLPVISKYTRVVPGEDGSLGVHVVDQAGDRRFSGVTGQPMTIAELVKELKTNENYKILFESDKPAGGGTPPSTGRKSTPMQRKPGDMSPTEKIAAGLANR